MKALPLMGMVLCAFSLSACVSVTHPAITAHRGASAYLPEHTLAAKAMAYAMGVDYLEQDVVLTRDNILVVLHDPTLETTTDVARKFPDRRRQDGHWYAIDFTLEEIKSLRVGARFHAQTGQAVFPGRFPVGFAIDFRVATLEEEILMIQGLNRAIGRNVGLYVEVKEPAFHEREGKDIMAATIELLSRHGYNTRDSHAILQIFDYEAVKKARELGWQADLAMLVFQGGQNFTDDREVHRWLLSAAGIRDVAQYATIYAPWFNHLALPAKDGHGYTVSPSLQWAREAGMKVHTWTHRSDRPAAGFTTEEAMFEAIFKEMKLDGLFSDFPDRVIAWLKANNLR